MDDQSRRAGIVKPSGEHQQVGEAAKSQLLIALVNRLGGSIEIPSEEAHATDAYNLQLIFKQCTETFAFSVTRKNR
jgi:hypothetical protein